MGPSGEPRDRASTGRIARGDFHPARARGKGLIRQRNCQIKTTNAAQCQTHSAKLSFFIIFNISEKDHVISTASMKRLATTEIHLSVPDSALMMIKY